MFSLNACKVNAFKECFWIDPEYCTFKVGGYDRTLNIRLSLNVCIPACEGVTKEFY